MGFESVVPCLLLMIPGLMSLKAYDCNHPEVTIVALQQGVGKCPAILEYRPIYKQRTAAVLEVRRTLQVRGGVRCRVWAQHLIYNCNHTDLPGQNDHPISQWEQEEEVSKEECQQLFHLRMYWYQGYPISLQPRNETGSFHGFYEIGRDYCDHSLLLPLSGRLFHNVKQHITLEIAATEIQGTYDPITGLGKFPTINLDVNYRDGTKVHHRWGRITWDHVPSRSCYAEDITEVYQGVAYEYARGDHVTYSPMKNGSLIIVQTTSWDRTGPTDEKYAGLILGDSLSYCNTTCYYTHLTQWIYCPWKKDYFAYDPIPYRFHYSPTTRLFYPGTDVARQHIQQQIKYTTKLSLDRYPPNADHPRGALALRLVLAALCQVQTEELRNLIWDLSLEDRPYTMAAGRGPGIVNMVLGRMIYVTRCQLVNVSLVNFHSCTQEIPAYYENRTVFLHPTSRIIQEWPTIVPCHPGLPVRWELDGYWYCARPSAEPCDPPNELQPLSPMANDARPQFKVPHSLQAPLLLRDQGAQVLQTLANAHQDQIDKLDFPDIGTILRDVDINYFITYLFSFTSGIQKYTFVVLWHYTTGALLLVLLLISVISTCLRFRFLRTRRGVGTWLFSCFMESTTIMFLVPSTIMRALYLNPHTATHALFSDNITTWYIKRTSPSPRIHEITDNTDSDLIALCDPSLHVDMTESQSGSSPSPPPLPPPDGEPRPGPSPSPPPFPPPVEMGKALCLVQVHPITSPFDDDDDDDDDDGFANFPPPPPLILLE